MTFAENYLPDTDGSTAVEALLANGYCIVPHLVPRSKVGLLHADLKDRFAKTPFCDGDFYGRRTKRFGGLLKRSQHAEAFVAHPLILDIVQRLLSPYAESVQLNLTQALELHPGETAQYPHRDQDMWRGAKGHAEYLINVMWPFEPYTADNGATIVWPGSHLRQDEESIDASEAVVAEMSAGSALVFLGSTLHGGGANVSARPRKGMIISYCLGWLKPYENQWLVYPPSVARHFSPELAGLVGYQQHKPNLGNYEGQCPSILLRDHVPDYIAATDELRPDQAEALAEYVATHG